MSKGFFPSELNYFIVSITVNAGLIKYVMVQEESRDMVKDGITVDEWKKTQDKPTAVGKILGFSEVD